MTAKFRDDLTLPLVVDTANSGRQRTPVAAFVPIALAFIGVGAVLFGGLSARDPATATVSIGAVDPIATGSIAAQPSGVIEVDH